jgi:hypothetical protein
MKKFKVTRTYSAKTLCEEMVVEAENHGAASKAAEEELDAQEELLRCELEFDDIFEMQEEVEEVS